MTTAVLLSSHVAAGGVGLKANIAALTHAGIDHVALPTTLLSNHPGNVRFAGATVEPATLSAMIDALAANGILASADALLLGYMPSAQHVALAHALALRVRQQNSDALVMVDPIFGDDPKGLYVDEAVARAIRETLLPLADIVTPNRFELQWLSERPCVDRATAVLAARSLSRPAVIATSIPDGPEHLANVLVERETACCTRVRKRPHAPHGAGDLFAGTLLAELAANATNQSALAFATATLENALTLCKGRPELELNHLPFNHGLRPAPIEPIGPGNEA